MSNPFTRETAPESPSAPTDGMPWLLPKGERRWRVVVPKVSSGVGLELFQNGSSIVVGGFSFSPEMTFIEGIQSHARWEPNSIQIGDHILAVNDEWVQGGSRPPQLSENFAQGLWVKSDAHAAHRKDTTPDRGADRSRSSGDNSPASYDERGWTNPKTVSCISYNESKDNSR
eukprot:1912580-Rhodomonas_salina.3